MPVADSPPSPPLPGRHRSTRDRPAKAPLSEDAVIDAALAILRSEGLEAVTMRRVAAALETGPASLYVYVAGREALLQAMQDRITVTIELETPDPARWREQVHSLVDRMRQALTAHPGMAATLLSEPPATGPAMRLFENLLGLLVAGGLGPQDAGWVADIFAMLVSYSAIEEDARRVEDDEFVQEISRRFAELPVEDFPLITTHAAVLVAGDRDARNRFAVDVVLDGVLARMC